MGSYASSSSGTIASTLSTAYMSSGSRFSMEAVAVHFDSLVIHEEEEHDGNNKGDWEEAKEDETEEERIRSLVQEFYSTQSANWIKCSDRSEEGEEDETGEEEEKTSEDHIIRSLVQEFSSVQSANCSINRDDMSVVEMWVILSVEDGAFLGKELDCDGRRSWTRALDQIAQTISFTSICVEQGKHVGVRCVPDRYRQALLILETMMKILTFVDIVVAWDPNTTQELHLSMDRVMLMPPPYKKLISLLSVHDALSEASYKILTQIHRSTSVAVRGIENEMTSLLSAYKNKLGVAIWSTMEKIRTKVMEDGDDRSSPQESSDIHKVTRSVMMYISFLWANYSSVDAAVRGKYVPHIENIPPLDNMIMEMVSCVEGKLANISESFPDQGLKFLFRLNNSYFIQEFQYFYVVNHQMKDHMERYLQVSWAPLLSSLSNSTPHCLGKNYSKLSKFESEFQKIYTTQKQWKVPDPQLRRRLREAIINTIIPGYKQYIEDNKATNPKTSPLELEEMLQELFEG